MAIILFSVFVALLLYMGFHALRALAFMFASGLPAATIGTILVAGIIYFAAHFLRVARLALIASDARLSLRLLTSVHLFTAGVSLGLPFKLGDIYRAGELAAISGGVIRGVTLVYVERVFDVAMILLLLVVALFLGSPLNSGYVPVLLASLLFVSITIAVLVLVPDNLRRISSYIIRRYDQEWTVGALRRMGEVNAIIQGAATMLNGRYASLFAVTLLIWTLEALSFAIIFARLGSDVEPLPGLLRFLSSITEGETLLNRLAPANLPQLASAALAYLAATQVPLLFVSIAAGLQLAADRGKARMDALSRRWSRAR